MLTMEQMLTASTLRPGVTALLDEDRPYARALRATMDDAHARERKSLRRVDLDSPESWVSRGRVGRLDLALFPEGCPSLSAYLGWVYAQRFPTGSQEVLVGGCLRTAPLFPVHEAVVVDEGDLSDDLSATDMLRENHICRFVGGSAFWTGPGPWSPATELVGPKFRPARRTRFSWAADDDLKDYRSAPAVLDDEDVDAELVAGVDFSTDANEYLLPLGEWVDAKGDRPGHYRLTPRRQAPVNIAWQQERMTTVLTGGDPLQFGDEEPSAPEVESVIEDDASEREGASMIEDFAEQSYDPQQGRQARVVVKRSTHRKPSDVRPVGSMIPSPEQERELRVEPLREQLRDEVGEALYLQGRIEDAYTVWEGDFDGTFLIRGLDDLTIVEQPKVWHAPLDRLPVWMAAWRRRKRDGLLFAAICRKPYSSDVTQLAIRNTEARVNEVFARLGV